MQLKCYWFTFNIIAGEAEESGASSQPRNSFMSNMRDFQQQRDNSVIIDLF